jgi:membrane-bound ClpP family serine protease
MAKTKLGHPTTNGGPQSEASDSEIINDQQAEASEEKSLNWYQFIYTSTDDEIQQRFCQEAASLAEAEDKVTSKYCLIALLDSEGSIGPYHADRLFDALSRLNSERKRDVLLVLLSRGGAIESAYQISKLCRQYTKKRFVIAIPRYAKSAATLIAIGADEIHIGQLGQLGPIDPQLGPLPALGVVQALNTIAAVAEKHPGSSDMFAQYLDLALTVEQIGYCDRVSESAVQYAERLLLTKPQLASSASKIARELVYEYKDHGFVIDVEEAQQHLGADWIKTNTAELNLAEKLYRLYEDVHLLLRVFKERRLSVTGDVRTGAMIFEVPKN